MKYNIAVLDHNKKSLDIIDMVSLNPKEVKVEVEEFLSSKYTLSEIDYLFTEGEVDFNLSKIIKLASYLAEEKIEGDWNTLDCSHEIMITDDGNLMFTGKALKLFKSYYNYYLKLLKNGLVS